MKGQCIYCKEPLELNPSGSMSIPVHFTCELKMKQAAQSRDNQRMEVLANWRVNRSLPKEYRK